MRVVLTDYARERLHEIEAYIALRNARAAAKVIGRVFYTMELLEDHPLLGHPWQGGPTRVFALPGLPYRLHYLVRDDLARIEVLLVAHTSQEPPVFAIGDTE